MLVSGWDPKSSLCLSHQFEIPEGSVPDSIISAQSRVLAGLLVPPPFTGSLHSVYLEACQLQLLVICA